MKRLLWLVAFVCCVASAAEQRNEFAYSAPFNIDQGAAAYEAPLSADVYRRAVYSDLRDIRVFNGAGEVVPYALRQPPLATETRRALSPASIFPLHGDAKKALDALRVIITNESGSVRFMQPAPGSQAAPLTGYIVDLHEQKEPIVAIELAWGDAQIDFATAINVAASDDLAMWRTIATNAPLMHLQFAGQRLDRHRVEFAATRAKYLRIEWPSNSTPITFIAASVEPVSMRTETPRLDMEAVGTHASDGFDFDLHMHAPIDRVSLHLPEINSLVQVKVWSRDDLKSDWRLIAQGTTYRLMRDDREIESPAISIPRDEDRYWRVSVDSAGGIGTGAPRLHVSWPPASIVFVARGTPPFVLAVGNNLAPRAESPLANIVKDETSNNAGQISAARAALGDFIDLGGPAKLAQVPPFAWKTWLLWAVLIFAVLIVAVMARRLYIEMNAEEPDSDAK